MSEHRVRTIFELEYLTRREAEERAAALQSPDLASRRVHIELADRYAHRVRTIQGAPV